MTPQKTTTPMEKKNTTILQKKNGSVFSPSSKIWVIFSHGKNLHAFNRKGKNRYALSQAQPKSLDPSKMPGDSSNLTRRERSTAKNTRQISFQIKPKNKSDKNKCPTKKSKNANFVVVVVVGIFCCCCWHFLLFPGLKIPSKTPPKTGGFLFVFFKISRMKNCKFDEVSERTRQGAQKQVGTKIGEWPSPQNGH